MSKILSFFESYTLDNYLIAILSSIILSSILVPSLVRIVSSVRKYNVPEDRITHYRAIPVIGGYVILISTTILFLILTPNTIDSETTALLGATFLLTVLGLRDDIIPVSARIKFISQVSCTLYMVVVFKIQISSFGGLLGINELPAFISISLSCFFVILILNSLNLIDGVDNLYNGFAILICSFLGLNFAFLGNYSFSILNFLLVGGLVGITYFNLHRDFKNRTFMGDGGTGFVGFIIAISSIKLFDPVSASINHYVFGIFLYPLFDTLLIFFVRIYRGKNLYEFSRDHFHLRLIDKGLSHGQTTIICLIIGVVFYITLLFSPINKLFTIIGLFLCFVTAAKIIRKKSFFKPTSKKMDKALKTDEIELKELYHSLGLKSNPFSRFSAEEEIDYLDKIYYKPKYFQPLYSDIKSARTRYILGARGVGKTALIIKLKQQLDLINVFSIIIDEFDGIPTNNNGKYFIDNTIRKIVTSFCISLLKNPVLIKKLKKNEKEKLSFFIENFYSPLTNKEFEIYLEKTSKFRTKNFWIRRWNLFSKPLNSILSLGIEIGGDLLKKALGLETYNASMVYKDYFKELDSLRPNKTIVIDNYDQKFYKMVLDDLSEIIKKSGFQNLVIIYDKIDEFKEIDSDISKIATFLGDVLKDTNLLMNSNFGLVFSLWDDLKNPLVEKGVRFDKITPVDVTWNNNDLVEIINTRLGYFSSKYKTSITISEILQDPASLDEIISISNKSPRDLLRLISYIYYEQANTNNRSAYLSTIAIQKGMLKFVSEYEYYSYFSEDASRSEVKNYLSLIIDLSKQSFNKSDLEKNLNISSDLSDKIISSLLGYSIIKKSQTLNSNNLLFKISDPKIQWLIDNQLNPWKN